MSIVLLSPRCDHWIVVKCQFVLDPYSLGLTVSMYVYVVYCKLLCRFSACSECMTLVSLVGSSLEYKMCSWC